MSVKMDHRRPKLIVLEVVDAYGSLSGRVTATTALNPDAGTNGYTGTEGQVMWPWHGLDAGMGVGRLVPILNAALGVGYNVVSTEYVPAGWFTPPRRYIWLEHRE